MWIAVLCGRGSGKTTALLCRLILRMVGANRQRCLYIAPTRQMAERLVWRDLKWLLLDFLRLPGVDARSFNESKLELTLPNGSSILLAGADDKRDVAKLRGITWHEVVVDEVQLVNSALLEELEIDVIGPRLLGPFVLAGTPSPELAGKFYEITRLGSEESRPYAERDTWPADRPRKWSTHSWSAKDGAEAGILELVALYERHLITKAENQWSDDNPHWKREFLGIWSSADSMKVYSEFRRHDDEGKPWNIWEAPRAELGRVARLPADWNPRQWGVGVGIDQGFRDAFALEAFTFRFDGDRTLWHIAEIYMTRQYARTIATHLLGPGLDVAKPGGLIGELGWPLVIVGDFGVRSGGSPLLAELHEVYQLRTIVAADKSPRLKRDVIENMNGELHDGRIKVMSDSKLAQEMTELEWRMDAHGNLVERESQANHASDAGSYVRHAIAPFLPFVGAAARETIAAAQALAPIAALPQPLAPKPARDWRELGDEDDYARRELSRKSRIDRDEW